MITSTDTNEALDKNVLRKLRAVGKLYFLEPLLEAAG